MKIKYCNYVYCYILILRKYDINNLSWWSRGMIRLQGGRGPEFNSPPGPAIKEILPLLTFRTRPTHTATTEVFIHIQLSIWYIIPQLTNLQRDSIKINKIQQALHVAQYTQSTPYVEKSYKLTTKERNFTQLCFQTHAVFGVVLNRTNLAL